MGDNHYDSDTDEYYDVNLSDICNKSDGSDEEDGMVLKNAACSR